MCRAYWLWLVCRRRCWWRKGSKLWEGPEILYCLRGGYLVLLWGLALVGTVQRV